MAIGTMASYTGEICVNRAEAPSWGITTAVVAGASELYPGHIATSTGNTAPDVARADADGDVTLGDIPAGSGAWSSDFFKLEVDMTNPQDPNEGIEWTVEYDDAAGNHHVIVDVPEFCPPV